jgi:hypothetical protein
MGDVSFRRNPPLATYVRAVVAVFIAIALQPPNAGAQTLVYDGFWLGAQARGGVDLSSPPWLFWGGERIGPVFAVSGGGVVNQRWRLGLEFVWAGDTGNIQPMAVYRPRRSGPIYLKGGLGLALRDRGEAGLGATADVGYYLPLSQDWGAIGVTVGLMLQWFGGPVSDQTTNQLLLFGVHGILW